jgi:GDP-mannose 6-dehydrogenase
MKISIFGMGYVGCVSGACLAKMGHTVLGLDVNPNKLEMIKKGQSPIIEPGLDALLAEMVKSKKLTVASDPVEAIRNTDISMICVGTPSRMNGDLDSGYIDRVIEQIGAVLAKIFHYHVVTIRSTLLPGIIHERVLPFLESVSGKTAGADFGFCVNPEFLRESTAIQDFQTPPFTVIGEINKESGDILERVYRDLPAPVYRVEPEAAAMVKYASNTFHALKVAFGNEIGAICKALEIDSQRVMEIFCQDKQLNISPAYLRPGFAFGGSCLPKDVRALQYTAIRRDVQAPVVSSLLPSNDAHIQRAVDAVMAHGKREIALLGLSFKPGTDDLRESPMVRFAETLIGKGFRLKIFDEEVSLSDLFGRNRDYVENVLPHIHELLRTDLENIVHGAEVIIIGKKIQNLEKIRALLRDDQVVLDLVGTDEWRPATRMSIV